MGTTPRRSEVEHSTITIDERHAGSFAAEMFRPPGPGPFPAVVLGAEGGGINSFIRELGTELAGLGVLAVVPDIYRGGGPADPEDYDDWEPLMAAIATIDFVRAGRDQVAAIDHVRALEVVDGGRVAVWGYCTGATLSWLAACADRELAAAVLFYPSQPVFDDHGDATPVDPMDLLWSVECPVLFLYGDDDVVMPDERMAELRRRIDVWGVDARIEVVPGAGHAFCAPTGTLANPAAAAASRVVALDFVEHTFGMRA